jgi:fructokinase
MARSDVVKASVEDLRWLEPALDPGSAATRILETGPRVVLVTDGPRPVRIVSPAGTTTVAVPDAPVVDTIGAGDAFGAGFLAAWIAAGRGRGDLADVAALAEAVELGVHVAAVTVGRAGALPPDERSLGDPMR